MTSELRKRGKSGVKRHRDGDSRGGRVTGGGPSDTSECEPNRCLAVYRRTVVTTVRIIHALRHNRPARAPDGPSLSGCAGTSRSLGAQAGPPEHGYAA